MAKERFERVRMTAVTLGAAMFSACAAVALSMLLLIGNVTPASAGWFDSPPPTSDRNMEKAMEKLMQQSQRSVGMPSIVNFFERRMVRMLYEMRDNPEYRTYSYIVTMDGSFIKICDSIGFGINASIQFSNPEKVVVNRGGQGGRYGTLPQMEPNGLSMPEGLAATYVMCVNPDGEGVRPVYVEPSVVVSPFPLN